MIAYSECGMKTFHNLFAALLPVSVLWSQTPWTNWGIYRDSTGNGANPVHGQTVCNNDTLWLVVDTTGMGAAGITGYRWKRVTGTPSPQVVHCTGSSDCPGSLPAFFPIDGIGNVRKLGVKPTVPSNPYALLLVTYYSNGDSAISVKSFTTKGLSGSISFQLPSAACAGSAVNGRFDFVGIVDSFEISYGSTTIKNQNDFTVSIPSGSGTLTVTATVYYCGTSYSFSHSINYYSSAPATGPSPNVIPSSSCPNAPLQFSISLPSGYTSFVWKVNNNSVDPASTNHSTSYSWTPPGPGNYTVSYQATYPCGTVSGSTTYTVNPPPTPSWSFFSISPPPNSPNYCPGIDVTIQAYAGPGVHTIDIGNDGSVEASGDYAYYRGPVGTIPGGGLPIRIRFDNGCGGTLDTLLIYNPSAGTASGSASILPFVARCGQLVNAELSLTDFPASYIQQVQWSWDSTNWTSPSNSLTAQLQVPSTPGPWTLYCKFVVASGAPACFTPPSSPVSTTISPNTSTPLLDQVTSYCSGSGGAVQLVPSNNIPNNIEGIDSIRYTLPDGTTITLLPTDTLSVTVPAGVSSYTIVYWGYMACGPTSISSYTIHPSSRPFINGSVWPSSVCVGGSISVGASWSSGQQIDSVVAILLWNNQRVPLPISGFSSAYVSAPTTPGSYEVAIIAYNCAGRDTLRKNFQVIGNNNAVAAFTAPASACVGDTVTFQRSGTNAGIWGAFWNFGDGSLLSDTSMSVTHIYTSAGTYTVFLWVQSLQCGYSDVERTIRVYAAPPTLSGLNVAPSGFTISYSVTASDYDQIVWNFGDGNTASGVLSGTHTYASAGNYTVKVQAINACDTTELSTSIVIAGLVSGNAGAWLVYPNPARQEVFFAHPTYQGDLRVEVYDLMGRLVQAEALSAYPARMRLNLPNGLYTLRLISREGVTTSKLLVE